MSLTNDDLQAIKQIVDGSVDELRNDVAAGFAEVHERLDKHQSILDEHSSSLGRIENTQRAEVARADEHGQEITTLKQKLA